MPIGRKGKTKPVLDLIVIQKHILELEFPDIPKDVLNNNCERLIAFLKGNDLEFFDNYNPKLMCDFKNIPIRGFR
jgi:hypothetical protein